MDKNIYFIEDSKYFGFAQKLSVLPLVFNINEYKDIDLHNWLINNIKDIKKVDILIIPCSLGESHLDYVGVKLALHLRLSECLKHNRYCRILFISSDLLNQILILSDYSFIFSTPGVALTEIDFNKIKKCIEILENVKFDEESYNKKFLNKILINKPQTFGNHEIGNLWGAQRLSEFCGIDISDKLSLKSKEKVASLFFKYKYSIFNHRSKNLASSMKSSVPFKTLLIDDKAEEGWSLVLEKLLHNINEKNKLDVLSSFKEEEYIKIIIEKIKNNNYDLILLDLRLFVTEESCNDTLKLSGSKVLKEIKKKTNFPYMPVIIFTASNKAWNLRRLFNIGADGYYIKESFEYGDDNSFSKENFEQFRNSLINLPERGKLLKGYWTKSNEIKDIIEKKIENANIKKRIEDKLDLAFGILTMRQNKFLEGLFIYTDFELAFLIYWSILNEIKADMFKVLIHDKFYIKNDNEPIYRRDSGNIYFGKFETYKKNNFELYKRTEDEKEIKNAKYDSFKIQALMLRNNFEEDYLLSFAELNNIRNKLDFTHSDTKMIKENPWEKNRENNKDAQKAKNYCEKMFNFIYEFIIKIY